MAIVTAWVIMAIITVLDIGRLGLCDYSGYQNYPNRHDRTGLRNRHSFFFLSFSDLNRVLNTRNAFQGSIELQSLTGRVISSLTKCPVWAWDSSSHNDLSFRS